MSRARAALPGMLTVLLLTLLTAPTSPALSREAAPGGAGWSRVEDLHRNPIGRMAHVARWARNLSGSQHSGRVMALGFVDITGRDDLLTSGHQVVDVAELKEGDPELHRQLRMDERPGIERFLVVKRSNDRSVFRGDEIVFQGDHAEQRVLKDMLELRVPTSRLFALYADLSPCKGKCTPAVPPHTDVFHGPVYREKGYRQQFKNLLDEASNAATRDPAFQREVAGEKDQLAALKKANRKRKYAKARRANATVKKAKHLLRVSGGGSCGKRNLGLRLALTARPGSRGDGCGTDSGATESGLVKALTEPVAKTGGIDFSSVELRYLSDPGDGSGLQYAFRTDRDPVHGDLRPDTGMDAAQQSSDAFFVWLSLPRRDLWVNLHPHQPDRIVEERLGRTDAGRVLLEADLRMKRTVGEIIHPRTALGKRYWQGVQEGCVSSRNWIVPGPASIHQDGEALYILDAPLDVKMETEQVTSAGRTAGVPDCPGQDPAAEARYEHLERTLVLPRLRKAVNTAPEYAALRRVHLARVAAEWYRELSAGGDTTYGALVDSGDVTEWRLTDGWEPREVFDEFVVSYTEGEYEVTDRTTSGGTTRVQRYTYGGVDLTSVPLRRLSSDAFDADFDALPARVAGSLHAPSPGGPDEVVWLGAPTPRQAADGFGAARGAVSPGTWAIRLFPVPLVALALWWWRRRRVRSAPASPLRRAATGGPRRRTGRTAADAEDGCRDFGNP
ncbi:hypothetical protein ACSMX9_27865 [Streptomyces sp. LE64]|uniref:hypothetical protein n=1 Tax=Streptomyces sp. LE64 TaxID=3448653 RepID=UPI0040434712